MQADTSSDAGCAVSLGVARTTTCTWFAPADLHSSAKMTSPVPLVNPDGEPFTVHPGVPVNATLALAMG
jgi:hypothetical protein